MREREAINALWALGKLNYKAKSYSDPLLQSLIPLVEQNILSLNLLDLGNTMAAFGLLEVRLTRITTDLSDIFRYFLD